MSADEDLPPDKIPRRDTRSADLENSGRALAKYKDRKSLIPFSMSSSSRRRSGVSVDDQGIRNREMKPNGWKSSRSCPLTAAGRKQWLVATSPFERVAGAITFVIRAV